MVEMVVHVNMVEREGDSVMLRTLQFVTAVAYTESQDPYGARTGGNMVLQGDKAGRAGYLGVAQQYLDSIVKEYRRSGAA